MKGFQGYVKRGDIGYLRTHNMEISLDDLSSLFKLRTDIVQKGYSAEVKKPIYVSLDICNFLADKLLELEEPGRTESEVKAEEEHRGLVESGSTSKLQQEFARFLYKNGAFYGRKIDSFGEPLQAILNDKDVMQRLCKTTVKIFAAGDVDLKGFYNDSAAIKLAISRKQPSGCIVM